MVHPPRSPFPPDMSNPSQGLQIANWAKPAAILLLGWAMSGLVGYFHTDASIASRLTAVETRQMDSSARLDRIENKVDHVLQVLVSK
jgi:hypothetical protein